MNETEKVPEDIGALIVSPKAYATQKELMAGFRWLRHNNRLGRVEAEGFDPFWAVTRHADIVEISRRHDLFRNSDRATTLVPGAADELARALTGGSPHLIRTLLQMDPPDHTLYRRITQSWFLGQNVASFAERDQVPGKILIREDPGEYLPLQQPQCVGIVAAFALQRRGEAAQALDMKIIWR